ncbi:hypothetical protein NAT51_15660 [Flavobacterium amniphilum]|uniref:hypothetical protein n=1 Tax=Flavobacterium amniphilum TaxID=1834035 RepID=UPI00202A6C45|nr:hypothetical protein [Flavobacterium amniphilum]MCL9806973.1 hypothetical protein [Flavobacterium amniphilum]
MNRLLSFIKILLFCYVFSFTKLNAQNRPRIIAIYPTSDSIPVNILRFYIKFSKPMQEMNILQHIKLLDECKKNITGVFYENQYELWNEDRTTITLLVDPGRVKLGLLANNKMGRAFDEGKKYSLEIDNLILDFEDQKLENNYTKTFIAVNDDIVPPDIEKWKLELPKLNSKETIVINFNDKINHISAYTLIKVFRDKKKIQGNVILDNHESTWIFKPNEKWKKGDYQVIVEPQLEDISANTINKLFDYKPTDYITNNLRNILKFTIK